MLIRQYVIPEEIPPVTFKQYYCDISGTPSVVWQQQMENAYFKTYKMVHNDRTDRYYDMDYKAAFQTRFRPL